jgi:hypothetical protein
MVMGIRVFWGLTMRMVKQSLYGLGEALTFAGGRGSQISRQSAHEGGKVVSPTHRPPLPPGNIPGTHFCLRLIRPQGHSAGGRIIMSMKNSNDTIGTQTPEYMIICRLVNTCRRFEGPICVQFHVPRVHPFRPHGL